MSFSFFCHFVASLPAAETGVAAAALLASAAMCVVCVLLSNYDGLTVSFVRFVFFLPPVLLASWLAYRSRTIEHLRAVSKLQEALDEFKTETGFTSLSCPVAPAPPPRASSVPRGPGSSAVLSHLPSSPSSSQCPSGAPEPSVSAKDLKVASAHLFEDGEGSKGVQCSSSGIGGDYPPDYSRLSPTQLFAGLQHLVGDDANHGFRPSFSGAGDAESKRGSHVAHRLHDPEGLLASSAPRFLARAGRRTEGREKARGTEAVRRAAGENIRNDAEGEGGEDGAPEDHLPAASLVAVLRDSQWRRVPRNMLAAGDVFKLRPGDPLPCDSVRVIPAFLVSRRGRPGARQKRSRRQVSPSPSAVSHGTEMGPSRLAGALPQGGDRDRRLFAVVFAPVPTARRSCPAPKKGAVWGLGQLRWTKALAPSLALLAFSPRTCVRQETETPPVRVARLLFPRARWPFKTREGLKRSRRSKARKRGMGKERGGVDEKLVESQNVVGGEERETPRADGARDRVETPGACGEAPNSPPFSSLPSLFRGFFSRPGDKVPSTGPARCGPSSAPSGDGGEAGHVAAQRQSEGKIEKAGDGSEDETEEEDALIAASDVAPDLASGTFIALRTSCVGTLRTFLEESLRNPASSKSRAKVPFFEAADLVSRQVAFLWLVACALCIFSVIFWDVVARTGDEVVPLSLRVARWQLPINVTFCMLMAIPRILGELTDIWGNARLQSLFQEAHYRARQDACVDVEGDGRVCRSISSSSWSTDDSSTASSVSSTVSVSNVPISKQIKELIYIFKRGLDGSSNLLHIMNSTTVLCFVDKDGILVDACRTLQEVAVGASNTMHTSAEDARGDSGLAASPHLHLASARQPVGLSAREDDLEEEREPSEDEHEARHRQQAEEDQEQDLEQEMEQEQELERAEQADEQEEHGAGNLRSPSLFFEGAEACMDAGFYSFLEVGEHAAPFTVVRKATASSPARLSSSLASSVASLLPSRQHSRKNEQTRGRRGACAADERVALRGERDEAGREDDREEEGNEEGEQEGEHGDEEKRRQAEGSNEGEERRADAESDSSGVEGDPFGVLDLSEDPGEEGGEDCRREERREAREEEERREEEDALREEEDALREEEDYTRDRHAQEREVLLRPITEFRKVVLDLINDDECEVGLRFENDSWIEYTTQLKPLALAMALTQLPRPPRKSVADPSWLFSLYVQDVVLPHPDRPGAHEELLDCQCSLAKIVGFSDTFLHKFLPLRFVLAVKASLPHRRSSLHSRPSSSSRLCLSEGIPDDPPRQTREKEERERPNRARGRASAGVGDEAEETHGDEGREEDEYGARSETSREKDRATERKEPWGETEEVDDPGREERMDEGTLRTLNAEKTRTSAFTLRRVTWADARAARQRAGKTHRGPPPRPIAQADSEGASARPDRPLRTQASAAGHGGSLLSGGERRASAAKRRQLEAGDRTVDEGAGADISEAEGERDVFVPFFRVFANHESQPRDDLRSSFSSSEASGRGRAVARTPPHDGRKNSSKERARRRDERGDTHRDATERGEGEETETDEREETERDEREETERDEREETERDEREETERDEREETERDEREETERDEREETERDEREETERDERDDTEREDEEGKWEREGDDERQSDNARQEREGSVDREALPSDCEESDVHRESSWARASDGDALMLWVVRDVASKVAHLFVKGVPSLLLPRVQFYLDGQQLLPFDASAAHSLLELNNQWLSSGLDAIAFGYRPLQLDQEEALLAVLHERSLFSLCSSPGLPPPPRACVSRVAQSRDAETDAPQDDACRDAREDGPAHPNKKGKFEPRPSPSFVTPQTTDDEREAEERSGAEEREAGESEREGDEAEGEDGVCGRERWISVPCHVGEISAMGTVAPLPRFSFHEASSLCLSRAHGTRRRFQSLQGTRGERDRNPEAGEIQSGLARGDARRCVWSEAHDTRQNSPRETYEALRASLRSRTGHSAEERESETARQEEPRGGGETESSHKEAARAWREPRTRGRDDETRFAAPVSRESPLQPRAEPSKDEHPVDFSNLRARPNNALPKTVLVEEGAWRGEAGRRLREDAHRWGMSDDTTDSDRVTLPRTPIGFLPVEKEEADASPPSPREAGQEDACEEDPFPAFFLSLKEDEGGELLRRLQSHLIFLGMGASKQLCAKEVAARIQDLHEAGIRFVFFSSQDEKRTRALGAAFGLETGWNCIISLQPSSAGDTYVNMDGKIVLPSGITAIRQHVEEVDNVPLQVSLFCNSTPDTVQEMMQVLQENNEVMTCVGSCLRMSNFPLFEQANASIATFVAPDARCRACGGRWSPVACNSSLPTLNPALAFAADLNSLPCALQQSNYPVADPHVTMAVIYEAFRESRRIVDSIQQSLTLCLSSSIFLSLFFLFNAFALVPNLLDVVSLLLFLLLFIPLLSLALLLNPKTDKLMKEYPYKPMDPTQTRRQLLVVFTHFAVRLVPSVIVISAVTLGYMFDVGNDLYRQLHRELEIRSATDASFLSIAPLHAASPSLPEEPRGRRLAGVEVLALRETEAVRESGPGEPRAGVTLATGDGNRQGEADSNAVRGVDTGHARQGRLAEVQGKTPGELLEHLERKCSHFRFGSSWLSGKWLACGEAMRETGAALGESCLVRATATPLVLGELFCFTLVGVTLMLLSMSYIDRFESLLAIPPLRNRWWLASCALLTGIIVLTVATRVTLHRRFLDSAACQDQGNAEVSPALAASSPAFDAMSLAHLGSVRHASRREERQNAADAGDLQNGGGSARERVRAQAGHTPDVRGQDEPASVQATAKCKECAAFIWPHWSLCVIAGFLWIFVVIVDELVKRVERQRHEQHQKYLKVLFATRLGMWSPK
ncbi:conserved hypothetical protein [Neospora caninum Liverpool]|uniref:Transmembrane protein n=1 Tax=Neospora caninum (strain Liverpool) TaxID=572307 RepID=F0VLK1_NEOCL|nr:conserved hypothetical protein [Neospora caninum Liverpool]CBZ54129.1 conserved hypothetical protein [Neospora caninum Liverpool]|eukprot:XP_003884160.1 conserved hypothetical protein [Neospora caninum Liverpool]